MQLFRVFAVSAAGAAMSVFGGAMALAAEHPDLVGTWKLTGEMQASVRLGAATDHHPEYAAPSHGKPADAWSFVIDGQQGRSFHGHAISPQGKQEPLVGVISHNGERLLLSGMEAAVYGEFVGDQIEFCFMDHLPDRASVACWMGAKE